MDSNNNLVLIGGGGHCVSVLDAAHRENKYDEIVISDPKIKKGQIMMGCSFVGDDMCLPDLLAGGYAMAFITLGSQEDTTIRRKLAEHAKNIGFRFPIIADPSASISSFAHMESGIFIGKTAVVNAEAFVGEHAIINSGAIIEHECHIGAFTHVSVGAILCGKVNVGVDCFIGPGAVIGHNVTIGDRVIIGANTTVLRDVPTGGRIIGN